MKGFWFGFIAILSVFNVNSAFAVAAANVSAAESTVASKAQATASVSNTTPAKATTSATAQPKTPEPETGYFEMIGSLGLSQALMGKSLIGISPIENDLIAQNNTNLQYFMGRLGVGYVHFLSLPMRYTCDLYWFPSVEAMLSLYYYDLQGRGYVLRFNNPAFNTQTFQMPIHSTALMLDFLINIVTYRHFSWFVLGGFGDVLNHISYKDAPNTNNPFFRPALKLKSRIQTNWAYEWGTGVSYAVNPQMVVDLEYLYAHIGNFKTSGNGTLGGVVDPTINPAGFSLRVQSLLFNIRYGFC